MEALRNTVHFGAGTPLFEWLRRVRLALLAVSTTAPFLTYESDLGGFYAIFFGLLFVGPYRDPVRNRWVIDFGLLGCAAGAVFAFVIGRIHHIALPWRCLDAGLALVCALPLLLCRHYLDLLEQITSAARLHRSRKIRRSRYPRRLPGR